MRTAPKHHAIAFAYADRVRPTDAASADAARDMALAARNRRKNAIRHNLDGRRASAYTPLEDRTYVDEMLPARAALVSTEPRPSLSFAEEVDAMRALVSHYGSGASLDVIVSAACSDGVPIRLAES
jgi:hypothetical protein